MNFNNYTIKSQEVIQKAIEITRENGNQVIEPATILKAIILQGDSLVKFIFQKLGISVEMISRRLDKELQNLPKVSNAEPYLSSNANNVLQEAENQAQKFGDQYVTVEMIILALLKVQSETSTILKDNGVNEAELKAAIEELRKGK